MAVCRRSSSAAAAPVELFLTARDRFLAAFLAVFFRPVFFRMARFFEAFFFRAWLRLDFPRAAFFRVAFFLALGFLMGVAAPSTAGTVIPQKRFAKEPSLPRRSALKGHRTRTARRVSTGSWLCPRIHESAWQGRPGCPGPVAAPMTAGSWAPVRGEFQPLRVPAPRRSPPDVCASSLVRGIPCYESARSERGRRAHAPGNRRLPPPEPRSGGGLRRRRRQGCRRGDLRAPQLDDPCSARIFSRLVSRCKRAASSPA